jgi:hypothetical protein
MDRASGNILDRNSIQLEDAHVGVTTHLPSPPFHFPGTPPAAPR